MSESLYLSGQERTFGDNEIIVTKTDLTGRITYTNRVMIRLSGYTETELLGTQHSIIRHPHMPRCVFKLLWETVQAGQEIFAYVNNRSINGDNYWVLAHVTPSFDENGKVDGYHSNRRVPRRDALNNIIIPLYHALYEKEESFKNRKEGLEASFAMLHGILKEKGIAYDQFIFSL